MPMIRIPSPRRRPQPAAKVIPRRPFVGRRSWSQNAAAGRWAVVLVAVVAAGCVSRQSADDRVRRAYEAGLEEGRRQTEVKLTHVLLRGPFQQPSIPWRDGLTLAKAIVAAVYTAPHDPVAISITRQNRIIPVDPADLLRGIDVPLEAGDVIDLR